MHLWCIFNRISWSHDRWIGHSAVSNQHQKVHATRRFPTPQTVKNVQKFVGMINYFYHHFIPSTARLLKPSYAVASGKATHTFQTGWRTANCFRSSEGGLFKNSRGLESNLINAIILYHPAPSAPLILSTDVGAVLEQEINGATHAAVSFFSRKLRDPELKYITFDRELLAVYLTIRLFKHILDGAWFRIRTDHRPLVHALVFRCMVGQQQRHLSAIAEMNCSFEYGKGETNPVADALSRVDICSVYLGIDYCAMSEEHKTGPKTLRCPATLTALKWENVILMAFRDNSFVWY